MANDSGNGVIVTGGTVEDAVKRALLQLNVTLDEIDVEVLSSGSRGVLGMGREDARVRVTVRSRPYSGGRGRGRGGGSRRGCGGTRGA